MNGRIFKFKKIGSNTKNNDILISCCSKQAEFDMKPFPRKFETSMHYISEEIRKDLASQWLNYFCDEKSGTYVFCTH